MSDFPVLDADRTHEHESIGRVVLDAAEPIEPYVPMTDSFIEMPTRIAHTATAGVVLEVGPYTLDHRDVRRLQDAIERFYLAGGGA